MKITVDVTDLKTDDDACAFALWLQCAIEGEHQVGQISWTE